MRLAEDFQEDIIECYKNVWQSYETFVDAVSDLQEKCSQESNELKIEAGYLKDFCINDISEMLHDTEEAFGDYFYPLPDEDDDEDWVSTGRKFREAQALQQEFIKNLHK